MAYELLGRLVWFAAKLYARRQIDNTPKKVAAALVVAGVVAALLAAQRRHADG
jgi:hypothetical protein